jgi:hypothetical protein
MIVSDATCDRTIEDGCLASLLKEHALRNMGSIVFDKVVVTGSSWSKKVGAESRTIRHDGGRMQSGFTASLSMRVVVHTFVAVITFSRLEPRSSTHSLIC